MKPINEVEEKRKRLLILSRYRQSRRFGAFLADNGFDLSSTRIVSLSLNALDALINDVRFTIACKNTGSLIETAAISGIAVVENIVSPFYNVKGLSSVLAQSDTYLDCVEEIALENQTYIYTKPSMRLMFEILKAAYMVNQSHNHIAQLQKSPEGQAVLKAEMDRLRQQPIAPPPTNPIEGIIQPQIEKKSIAQMADELIEVGKIDRVKKYEKFVEEMEKENEKTEETDSD